MKSGKSKIQLQTKSPTGRKESHDLVQSRLLDLHFELSAYGFLFSNLKNCELCEDDLYGMGVVFNKMAKRVSKISEEISLS